MVVLLPGRMASSLSDSISALVLVAEPLLITLVPVPLASRRSPPCPPLVPLAVTLRVPLLLSTSEELALARRRSSLLTAEMVPSLLITRVTPLVLLSMARPLPVLARGPLLFRVTVPVVPVMSTVGLALVLSVLPLPIVPVLPVVRVLALLSVAPGATVKSVIGAAPAAAACRAITRGSRRKREAWEGMVAALLLEKWRGLCVGVVTNS